MALFQNRIYGIITAMMLFASVLQAGNLGGGNLKVEPHSSATFENTIHKVSWTAGAGGVGVIDVRARFILTYDPAFNLDDLIMATTIDSATMDGRLNIDSTYTDASSGKEKVVISRKDRTTNGEDLVGMNIALVGNPGPGDYNFHLQVWEAGVDPFNPANTPQDSGSAVIAITEKIKNFDLAATNYVPRAGEPFDLVVSNAIDNEGNVASGVILVSFNDGLDHTAPDGSSQPILVSIPVQNGSGMATQTLVKTENNLFLKGTVSGGTTSRTTNAIAVKPGDVGSFTLMGYPATTTAGTDFGISATVRIKAYDAYGNAKTDLAGDVYFESTTDTNEDFEYDVSNPYVFSGIEDGEAAIPGDLFEFRTSGFHTFSVVHGMITEESNPIQVYSGAIDNFDFGQVENQTAGIQFELSVTDAEDVFGNAANGTISIGFTSGDHSAPNGQTPVFTNIQVVNGTGSAFQTLVNTETIFLTGETTGSISRTTNIFTVGPSTLAGFSLTGYPQSTQSNQFFADDVFVTAYDMFGNQKTNFNSSITFSSTDTDPGVVLPEGPVTKFEEQSTKRFTASQFKLMTLGTQTITVESAGKMGTTAGILVEGANQIQIVRLIVDPATVTQGQTQIPVSMEVRNSGSDLFQNYIANINFRIGPTQVNGDYIAPADTGSVIGANSTMVLNFLVDVRESATLHDSVVIDGNIVGNYNGIPDQVDQASNTDFWAVQRQAVVQIKSLDVVPDTVSQGSGGIIITTTLANNEGVSNSADAVIDVLSFVFQDQTFTDVSQSFAITPAPTNPTTIAGDASANFIFYLSSDATAPLGPISVSHEVTYQDANLKSPLVVSGASLDSFESVGAATIVIGDIVSDQLTVTQGQTNQFKVSMKVKNDGASSFSINLDADKTYLQFKKGGQEYISPDDVNWPTELRGGGLTISPADSGYLDFWVNQVQGDVPTGNYIIIGRVESTDLFFTTSDLSNSFGDLEVQSPEDLLIKNVYSSQATATVNNSTHPWKVGVVLENRGGSDVSIPFNTSQALMKNNGGGAVAGFEFGTPFMFNGDNQLSSGEVDTLFFPVTKTGSPSGVVTIDAHVEYVVNNTGQSDSKEASAMGQTGSVLLQDASNFSIVSVTSSLDSVTLGATPTWQVAVGVENTGEAAVEFDLSTTDSTWLKFFNQAAEASQFSIQRPLTLQNSGGTVLAGGESDVLVYNILSNTADAGEYVLKSAVKATETNTQIITLDETQFSRIDTVWVTSASGISYVAGTLAPVQAAQGRNLEFQLRVQNNGDATVLLDPATTTFTINGGTQQFVAQLDEAYGRAIAGQSEKVLIFRQTYLSSNIVDGSYTPQVVLNGVENGDSFSLNLDMNGASVVIGEEGEIRLENLQASTPTVTQGQTSKDWFIEVGVTNNSVQILKLQSAEFIFFKGTEDVSSEFIVQVSDTLTNGVQELDPGASSAVRVTVSSVSANLIGEVVLSAKVTMSDQAETGVLFEQQINNADEIIVQTPAELQIVSFHPSQLTVTNGQTESWYVGARLRNDGESALTISNLTLLDFVGILSSDFDIVDPIEFVGSNSDTLMGMSEDSLHFEINRVDVAADNLGPVQMNANFVMDELNTGERRIRNTENVTVTIQDSASVRIDDFRAIIESDSLVNTNQIFQLQALVTNSGGANADMVKRAIVKISKDAAEYSFDSNIDTVSVDSIAAGESKWTNTGIRVLAPSMANIAGVFTANVDEAIARNTNSAIPVDSPINNSVSVKTQNPADFRLLSVVSDRDTVSSGFELPWTISAIVTNSGDGIIELLDVQSSDFKVYNSENNLVENYIVEPVAIDPQNRRLGNGDSDTLEYVVRQTWKGAGNHQVEITVRGKDLNNTAGDPIALNGSTQVYMTSNATVRIVETRVDSSTNNTDDNGDGLVNTSQEFFVKVKVRSEGQYIRDVSVVLDALESHVPIDTQVVTEIAPNTMKEATFRVTASDVENLTGDILTARITAGNNYDGDGAIIKTAFDSTANVKIFNPAQLRIVETENLAPNVDKNVSLGQYFDVRVIVRNEGSETAKGVSLSLASDNLNMAAVDNSPILLLKELAGAAVDTAVFRVKAGSQEGQVNFTSDVNAGIGANNGETIEILTPGNNNSTYAVLTPGAKLTINKVWPNVESITGGIKNAPWQIWVEVENSGGADLEFTDIADTNVAFSVNGVTDDGYIVIPPTALLKSGNLILAADSVDTLKYIVDQNGQLAGQALFSVVLKAIDKNTNGDSLLTAIEDSSVFVSNNARVQIFESNTDAALQDEIGFSLVNRGQAFNVDITIRGDQNVDLEKIIVKLTSDGQSLAPAVALFDTLESIAADEKGSAIFPIRADDSWDVAAGDTIEVFTAEIIQAFSIGDTTSLSPQPPATGANIAKVRIQTPAELSYSLQLGEFGGTTVQNGNEFTVVAKIRNLGKAPFGPGKLSLTPPAGYEIKNNGNVWGDLPIEQNFSIGLGSDSIDVPFELRAPIADSGPDSIRARVIERPNDSNTNEPVLLSNIDSVLVIRSASTLLEITSLSIESPQGAVDGTLSTDQIFTIQAVISSSQSIPDRKATLNIPLINVNSDYKIEPPQTVAISSESETITWNIIAPTYPVQDAHDFELVVTGGVPGGDDFVRETKDLTINQVQRKTILLMENLTITPAGVMKDGQAYFTQGQPAELVTSINNEGGSDYEGSGKVRLELGDSGFNLRSGELERSFNSNQDIVWEIQAPSSSTFDKEIKVSIIETPQDENSNATADVPFEERALVVHVNSGGSVSASALSFLSTTNEAIDSVSSEQPFTLKALIRTANVKATDIKATLISTNGQFQINDPIKIIPNSGDYYQTWTVTAPIKTDDTSDRLYVKVEARDLQSEAPLTNSSPEIMVPVAERTLFSFDPYISLPTGMEQEDRLSTGQKFDLTTKILHTGADYMQGDSFKVQISLPVGFVLDDDEQSVKAVAASDFANNGLEPTWSIIAPEEKDENLARISIIVRDLPRDNNSKLEAKTDKDEVDFPVRTVEKARIHFTSYLHNDVTLDSASVRSGNVFKITSLLNNIGEAGITGEYKVRLDLPDLFTFVTDTSHIKTATMDTVSWWVRAPLQVTSAADTFMMRILELPLDEYAKAPVSLESDSTAFVQVVLQRGALIVNDYKVRDKTAVLRGAESIPILGMTFKNKEASGTTKSFMQSIKLSVRNKKGEKISPKPIISRIAAVKHDDDFSILAEERIFGDSGSVVLDFVSLAADTIIGSSVDSIKFIVDLKQDAEITDFRFTIDSDTAISAIDEYGLSLIIADSTGSSATALSFSSMMAVMVDGNLSESFFNYPNPFGSFSRPETNFNYYLKEESNVKIHVYTLTGQLVRVWEFTKAEHPSLTSAGLHQGEKELIWDGTNGMGHPIVNGVYLAFISTDYGEQATTKIAVVR
jgi:hypothetical protein